jgi:hypothetical protein
VSVPGSENGTADLVTTDELAVCFLKGLLSTENPRYADRKPYRVDDGLHSCPRCTKDPEGPQPTRNDRPYARPASTKASSTPFTIDAEPSTLAYLREGRKVTGSISWAKEAR